MAGSARVVRNTVANGIGGFTATALGVVLAPIMIAELGLQAYGIYALALTLSFAGGYAALSDLGIEQATVRYVAEAEGGAPDQLNRIVATTLLFFAGISLPLAILLVLLAPALTDLFSVGPGLRSEAEALFALIAAQLVFEMPARAFTAVLEGTQRFMHYQAVEVGKAVAITGGIVVVLATDGGLRELGIVYAAAAALTLLAYWALAHRIVVGLRAGPRHASRAEFRRLLGYGTSVFAFRLMGTLHRQMDKVILGVATTPSFVALYEIANKLQLAVAQVHAISTSALLPAAAAARRDAALLRDMFVRGTSYTVAVGLPVAIGALIFAEPLLRDWIGREALDAVTTAQLLLAFSIVTVFQNVGTTIVVALGRVRRLLLITVAVTLLNLGLSIALVGRLEADGVALGTLIASACGAVPLLTLFLREVGVSLTAWWRRVVLVQLPGAFVQIVVGTALLALVDPADNLLLDGLAVLASVAAYLAAYVTVGMRGPERDALLGAVRGALSKRHGTPT